MPCWEYKTPQPEQRMSRWAKFLLPRDEEGSHRLWTQRTTLEIKIGKGLRIEGSKASIKKLATLCQCSNPHTNSKIKNIDVKTHQKQPHPFKFLFFKIKKKPIKDRERNRRK